MADVDNKDTSAKNDQSDAVSSLRGELDSKLAQVTEQIKAMNESFAQSLQTIVQQVTPQKKQEPAITDNDIYDPAKLASKVSTVAEEIASKALAKERSLNAKIYELAQDFPEIQSDSVIRKAVLEEHAKVPANMRDTAEGYEIAVLKAVAKQGLVAKSKRKEAIEDEGTLSSRGSSGARKQGSGSRKKVSEATLMVAELLGRDISDEKVLKGLEEAANRETYNRYR